MSIERRYPLLKHAHDAADITSGVFSPSVLGTGTADHSQFLRGDGSWNDTLVGRINLQPASAEAVRMSRDDALLSFYNTADTVRTAAIQANAGSTFDFVADTATSFGFYMSGYKLTLTSSLLTSSVQTFISTASSPMLRLVAPTGGPWAIDLYRTDYTAGSKVFAHKYDGTNIGWSFEHMPYVPGIRESGGSLAKIVPPLANGSNTYWYMYSHTAGGTALRLFDSAGSNGVWLYASGSDYGILNHAGSWSWQWDNANGLWRSQIAGSGIAAMGFYDNSDTSKYMYSTAGYTYGTWRMGGARSGYVGIVFDISAGEYPTLMYRDSDGLGGIYYQTDARWSFYDDHTYFRITKIPLRESAGAMLHYASSSFLSGNITVQSGGSPSGGSDGDIYLIY